jgi:predicted DNA-binding protein YlxM (UPF0122 family)
MGTDSIIDRTNRFYLEISQKLLSEKEYDILRLLLLEKQPVTEVATLYHVSPERIYQIYRTTHDKVKCVAGTLKEIGYYKEVRDRLVREASHYGIKFEPSPEERLMLSMPLFDSPFPFSRRMYNMLCYLEVGTVGDLAAIPLKDLQNFRGFKTLCKKELIAFIEFEGMESLFEGFYQWKEDFFL